MTAPLWTYIYLTLLIADILSAALALNRRNYDHLTAFIVGAPMLWLGFMNNIMSMECYVSGLMCFSNGSMMFK